MLTAAAPRSQPPLLRIGNGSNGNGGSSDKPSFPATTVPLDALECPPYSFSADNNNNCRMFGAVTHVAPTAGQYRVVSAFSPPHMHEPGALAVSD